MVFNTDYRLMSLESILQYFPPSLSYHLVFKIYVLSIFEWPLKTGFTVPTKLFLSMQQLPNLAVAGPTVAQLEVFFSSDYL